MNNTKWLRRALLSGAALSVMATGAQADELSALKAQLEALQSRVSQLESQPAPALPPGTKLLTVRKGQGTYAMNAPLPARDRLQEEQGYTIAVTPTADMPAPVSEVTVSGEIRARALYGSLEIDGDTIDFDADDDTDDDPFEQGGWDEDDFDITTRGRLRVDGRTETAIGEVGGTIRIQGTQNEPSLEIDDISMNIIWGYWQMTPNWQLGGGYWDSAAAIQAGWDWNGEPSLVGLNAGPTNKSVSQFRITYNNGGLTAAVSVEDNNNRGGRFDVPAVVAANDCRFDDPNTVAVENAGIQVCTSNVAQDDAVFPAVAGFISFDAGSFLVTAAAVWEADDSDVTDLGYVFEDTEDNWAAGIGAILRVSDMFRLEGAANIGEGYTGAVYGAQICNARTTAPVLNAGAGGALGPDCENDFEYWSASLLGVVSFHEAMRLELGAAYTNLDHEADELADTSDSVETQWTIAASLFWDPVDQLTIGAGVGWTNIDSDDGDAEADQLVAGFGTWFRF